MKEIIKKTVVIIFFLGLFAGTFFVTSITFNKNLDAACCPGSPGCSGTCQGARQNPPGGCGCYTNSEGCGSCGSPPPPPPPPCVGAAPKKATNTSPLNGSINNPKPVTFKWVNGAWGNGCPSTLYNRVFYRLKGVTACSTLTGYTATAYFAGTTSHVLNTELQWGSTYCWYIDQFNATYHSYSVPTEFTTSIVPTYTGGGFSGVDVCGNQSSGRAGAAGVTNPIDWNFSFNNPEPGNVPWWYITLMVPTTGSFAITADTFDWTTAYNYALNAGTFVFGLAYNPTSKVTSYMTLQQSPLQWNASAVGSTTLNSANGRATLYDLGTNTSHTEAGSSLSTKWRIGFNNTFPSGTYNMYSIVLIGNSSAYFASNDATAANPYIARKTGTWKVDTAVPSATVSGPIINADGTFNMTWSASDNIAISDLKSYIYSDTNGSTLHDNTTGGADIVTSTTEPTYPFPSNAGITPANLGSKNYTDKSAGSGSEYDFKISVKDAACNITEYKAKKDPLTPWILGVNGDISGRDGIDKTQIPVIASFNIPFTTSTGNSYFVQNGAISGTGTNADGTVSKYSESVLNYLDDAVNAPHSTTGIWYDYLLDLVTRNAITAVATKPSKTISSTMSSGLVVAANSKYAAEITGDLTITSKTACDLRAIVFVRGNLSIDPDFTITAAPATTPIYNQLYNGCIFIVKGNVNITKGQPKTVQPMASPTLASYDVVNAFILSDGTFNVPADPQGTGQKGDGLYINGGVVARNTVVSGVTTIKRDINQQGNNLQPATFFNLDPRIKLTFGDDFASRDYAVREFGL
ncbi:MAG: hypothetical protein ACMG57_05170 [Candidatus Dojkabacteria bacterium]